jgi:ADP-ribose pyrophosphatase
MTTGRRARRLSQKRMFSGRIFDVTRDRVRLPHGPTVVLDVVRHRGSVVMIPEPAPGRVLLVRQYRYAIGRWIWELPAGSLEPGERPDRAARRECAEEIGLVPGRIARVADLFPTPGFCDERMIFYRCLDLRRPARAAVVDEDEDLEPREFTRRELDRMIRDGDIVDMKTVVGLTMTRRA